MPVEKWFNMGKLQFCALPIKCSECTFDFSSDEQMIYEFYLNMVERSKVQGEPQRDKYVDYYKQNIICSSLLRDNC